MFRRIAIALGVSTAALIGFAPAASAQGVTLTIGSPGYGYGGYGGYGYSGYGYSNSYPSYAYGYPNSQYYGSYPAYGYNGYSGSYGYNGYSGYNGYDSGAYRRQLEHWRRERARYEQRVRRDREDDRDDD